jgi:hypothetical protein
MAEKDDLQNLGGDLDPPQSRFLPEPSSGLRDKVPLPGTTLALLSWSDKPINDVVKHILAPLAYRIGGG